MPNAATTRPRKHATLAASAISAAMLCAMLLMGSGCASEVAPTAEEKPVTASSYMVSLNQAAQELSSSLSEFSQAATDGNLTQMQVKAESAYAEIDAMANLEAPEELAEVKEKYNQAAGVLKTALSEYLTLYMDIENAPEGTFDFASYSERIESVQQQYDEGLNLLEEADKMASEM